jgi:hypothetical protein
MLLAPSVSGLFKWRANLNRRLSCLRSAGTCASRFPIVMWRSCWPSGACTPITSRCGDGYSVTPRKWNDVCAVDSNQPATVGGWTLTYIRVKGKWVYLYRAVDSTGATIDFLLSAKRDTVAAKRFLAKALGGANHPHPGVINTDKDAAYPPAIVQLKAEGALEENCQNLGRY